MPSREGCTEELNETPYDTMELDSRNTLLNPLLNPHLDPHHDYHSHPDPDSLPHSCIAVVLPIQIAALLMTMVRKSIISAGAWHYYYTLSLLSNYIVGPVAGWFNPASKFSPHTILHYATLHYYSTLHSPISQCCTMYLCSASYA